MAQPEPAVEGQLTLLVHLSRHRRRSLFGQRPLPYRRRPWAEDRGPRQRHREEEQDMPHVLVDRKRKVKLES